MFSAFPITGLLINHLNRWLGGNHVWKVLLAYGRPELMREMHAVTPTPTYIHKERSLGTVCNAICPAWGDTKAMLSVPFPSLEMYAVNRAKKLWNILW